MVVAGFSLRHYDQIFSGIHSLLSDEYQLTINRLEGGVHVSAPSIAEVKNTWSFTSVHQKVFMVPYVDTTTEAKFAF
jgi:hypothetical protein